MQQQIISDYCPKSTAPLVQSEYNILLKSTIAQVLSLMNATLKKYLLILGLSLSYAGLATSTFAAQSSVELREINQLSEQGNQAAALEKVNSYLTSNPKNAEAMFMRGVILVELGKRDDAIKAFTEITEKYPNLPEPYNNLAVLYADQGQYDKARKALEAAIKTHPSYATAHENLGDIYARLASEAYDKALKLDTSNTRAQNKLAMITDLFSGKRSTLKPVASSTAPVTGQVSNTAPPAPATTNTTPVVTTQPANQAATASATQVEPKKPETIEPKANDNTETAVIDAVNTWSQAWSSQNVDQYLASYAKSFKTPDGESRQKWESVRRERVSKPSKISVKLINIEVKMANDNSAIVHFKQEYRATGLKSTSNKTLNMVKEGSHWLINQERVGRY